MKSRITKLSSMTKTIIMSLSLIAIVLSCLAFLPFASSASRSVPSTCTAFCADGTSVTCSGMSCAANDGYGCSAVGPNGTDKKWC